MARSHREVLAKGHLAFRNYHNYLNFNTSEKEKNDEALSYLLEHGNISRRIDHGNDRSSWITDGEYCYKQTKREMLDWEGNLLWKNPHDKDWKIEFNGSQLYAYKRKQELCLVDKKTGELQASINLKRKQFDFYCNLSGGKAVWYRGPTLSQQDMVHSYERRGDELMLFSNSVRNPKLEQRLDLGAFRGVTSVGASYTDTHLLLRVQGKGGAKETTLVMVQLNPFKFLWRIERVFSKQFDTTTRLIGKWLFVESTTGRLVEVFDRDSGELKYTLPYPEVSQGYEIIHHESLPFFQFDFGVGNKWRESAEVYRFDRQADDMKRGGVFPKGTKPMYFDVKRNRLMTEIHWKWKAWDLKTLKSTDRFDNRWLFMVRKFGDKLFLSKGNVLYEMKSHHIPDIWFKTKDNFTRVELDLGASSRENLRKIR